MKISFTPGHGIVTVPGCTLWHYPEVPASRECSGHLLPRRLCRCAPGTQVSLLLRRRTYLFPSPGVSSPLFLCPSSQGNSFNFSLTFPNTWACPSETHPTAPIALSRCFRFVFHTVVISYLSLATLGSLGRIVGSPFTSPVSELVAVLTGKAHGRRK